MTGGQSPIDYLKAYMTNLYLSKDSSKVHEAIEEGTYSTFKVMSVPLTLVASVFCFALNWLL